MPILSQSMSQAPDERHEPTHLIERWRAGEAAARDRLVEVLHDELRTIARRLMRRERDGHTLEPTGVVHEAWLRLIGSSSIPAASRRDFLGLAARLMRQILVDHARRRESDKRGGDWGRVSLTSGDSTDDGSERLIDALDLDAALHELAELSPRQAEVAELRYYGGLTVPETAEVLGVAESTVKADWSVARLWLARHLREGEAPGPQA